MISRTPLSLYYLRSLDFRLAVRLYYTTTTSLPLLLLLPLPLTVGRINSRMTSYLKIFVLIDFHFQDAIFPFTRAAPYGSDERGSKGARPNEREERGASPRSRPATERRTSRGEISFQLPFKRYPIKNFGEQPGGQI